MAIAKLLSFIGTGAIAISPFTLFVFSKEKSVTPIFKENLLQIKTTDNLSTKTTDIHGSGGATISLSQSTVSKENNQSIPLAKDPSQEKQQLSSSQFPTSLSEEAEEIKLEANLNEWLNNIDPSINSSIAKEEELILIARWEKWYFLLVRWDKDCQCFLKMDENDGIWTNRLGLFTIGKKWENPNASAIPLSENSKCSGFDSFWWQNWDTWGQLQSWLTTIEIDETSHKAMSSCYERPVIFLGTNKLIPLFTKHKGHITPLVDMNYHYDYKKQKFLFPHLDKIIPKHSFNLRDYSGWRKLWKLRSN